MFKKHGEKIFLYGWILSLRDLAREANFSIYLLKIKVNVLIVIKITLIRVDVNSQSNDNLIQNR